MSGYWGKSSDVEKNNYSNNVNDYHIFNKITGKWETIKLNDFVNSFVDKEKGNFLSSGLQNYANSLVSEITKLQNTTNIVGEGIEKDPEKLKIKKMYDYINELNKQKESKGE